MFRHLSIQWKLLWVSLLASGTTLVLLGLAFVLYDRATLREVMVRQLAGQANIIALNSAAALLFDDPSAAAETLAALRVEPRIMAAGIYRTDGQRFATYGRQTFNEAGLLPSQFAAPGDGHRFTSTHLVLFRAIVGGGQTLGTVYILADLQEIEQRLGRYLSLTSLVGLASLALALGISSRLQRRIAGPLVHLAHIARRVSAEQRYTVRVPVPGRDELGLLSEAFNAMLTQIQARDAALQQAHDVLEQRVIERTAELEVANRELEAFSYSISHDLRAPLRAINGFARILLEEHTSALPEEAQEYCHFLRDNAQHMGQLIDDLLAFSRLSRQPLSRQRVAPADLVRQALSELRAIEGERQIEVQVGDLPLCQADPALLRQVLINLLGNAFKFTSQRQVALIEVGAHRAGGETVYFVKDNGVGFNMAYADKLFGVFQRLHRADEYEGTGVGLAIVQRIIHRHGGRIWAEAAVQQGATFFFTLGGESGYG
ncbi:MAG: ATP-binding protein [Candidatus Tectimicrobiota bacterium]